MKDINKNIKQAARWSTVSELVSKLVNPISNMILARILAPEAYGVVATLTMIITFAEIFTDAGFQKYLVQHEFTDDKDRIQSTDVAFWTNLIMSLFLWIIIIIFSTPLANIVGNPGLGHVISISCISIPIAAFSSIQTALYKRDFDFKTLFKVRMVGICVPLLITVPLALWLKSYWALVIATIIRNSIDAFMLTYFSKWRPKFFYSFKKIREMLSFTIWSMLESILVWATNYIDIFLIGMLLSTYYLGIYKTSMNTVTLIISLITSATTPILFSSLSRLQDDDSEFKRVFYMFQKTVGLLIIPLGIGIYCYSDVVTSILLGEQWKDAIRFIGLWGLSSSFVIIFSHYASEVYRSKGFPKMSVFTQIIHLCFLAPTIFVSAQYGFEILCMARSLIRFQGIIVHLLCMSIIFHFSCFKMFKNITPSLLASLVIIGLSTLSISIGFTTFLERLFFATISAVLYFVVLAFFKDERDIMRKLILKRNEN